MRYQCAHIDPQNETTVRHLLEVDEHQQREHQSGQAERIAAHIDVRGHIDGRLEVGRVGVRQLNVLALVVVGVIVPRAVGGAQARCIVC